MGVSAGSLSLHRIAKGVSLMTIQSTKLHVSTVRSRIFNLQSSGGSVVTANIGFVVTVRASAEMKLTSFVTSARRLSLLQIQL